MTRLDKMTIDKRDVGAYVVRVVIDDDPMSPRDWDNVGRFAGLDRWTFSDDPASSVDEAYRDARVGGPIIALPVKVVDGSYTMIQETDDWGYADGIYWAAIAEVDAVGDHGYRTIVDLKAAMRSELETMNLYLEGSVYGYVVEGPDDEHDSCWGFFSTDDAMTEGMAAAQRMESARWERWAALPEWVRGQVLAWDDEAP